MGSRDSFSRLFTVEEANGLLPALLQLMERVHNALRRLKAASATVIRRRGLNPEAKDLMGRLKEDESVAREIEKLKSLVDEINSLGCICKGVEEGLVDFPCAMGEDVVLLCWRHGEERIDHWHRFEDGFAGRRPLLDPKAQTKGGSSYH